MVNNIKTTMLLAMLMALCGAAGYFVGGGTAGLLMGFLVGGIGNLVAFFFSDKIALASTGAQEVRRADIPWLYDMVEDLSARAGLPMPRVYVFPQAAPNAFATGRGPSASAVAISEGMLRGFPRHEIEGVMAHELAHIKHRDVLIATIAATMAGMLSMLGYMFMFSGGSRENNNPLGAIGAILMIVLAPIAALIIQMAISRSREYEADRYGGELCGDPMKLAGALQRLTVANQRIPTESNPAYHSMFIVAPLSGGLAGMFSTHPPAEKRIALLRRQAGAY